MKKHNSKLAFSLIELSIVILIIGILIIGISKGSRIIRASKLRTAQSLTTSSPVASIDKLGFWIESTSDKSFVASEVIDNSLMSTWYDINPQTTTPNNATQGTSSNKPKYFLNDINGLPAIRFDGSDDFMNYDGTMISGSDYTVFFVEQRRDSRSNQFFFGATNTGTNTMLITGYRFNNTLTFDQFSNGSDYNVPVFTSIIPRIHTYRLKVNSVRNYYVNGVLQNPTSSGTNVAVIGNVGAIFGKGYTGSEYFGDIGEFIIFSKYLTDSERASVESYLKTKWGIK